MPLNNNEIPNGFSCPITFDIMIDPVIASDNITYERSAIEQSLSMNNRSPVTREPISRTLRPNLSLKKAITEYQQNTNQTPRPTAFICTITTELMTDPVIASDGYSYERSAIEEWFRTSNKSPVTNQALSDRSLQANVNLKQAIDAYRETHHLAARPAPAQTRPAARPSLAQTRTTATLRPQETSREDEDSYLLIHQLLESDAAQAANNSRTPTHFIPPLSQQHANAAAENARLQQQIQELQESLRELQLAQQTATTYTPPPRPITPPQIYQPEPSIVFTATPHQHMFFGGGQLEQLALMQALGTGRQQHQGIEQLALMQMLGGGGQHHHGGGGLEELALLQMMGNGARRQRPSDCSIS